MIAQTTHYTSALHRGVHTTEKNIGTRRNGHQWHAPLGTFDAPARAALAAGQVVRNHDQGFDAFPAGAGIINVRFSPSS